MMKRVDFEREVSAAALAGLAFWSELKQKRPDLTCRCHACRPDPWQHVKCVLMDCGFSESAT